MHVHADDRATAFLMAPGMVLMMVSTSTREPSTISSLAVVSVGGGVLNT
jgi:non-ribosomal peptide synthetase component E (peptide arylation enzyme)